MNDITDTSRFFIPRKLNATASLALLAYIKVKFRQEYEDLHVMKGWTFYAIDKARNGRCHYASKTITIPTWAIARGVSYADWYIAHEMAHAYAGHTAMHGPVFMNWLKLICPEDSIHHELGYKPANAARAGIMDCRGI